MVKLIYSLVLLALVLVSVSTFSMVKKESVCLVTFGIDMIKLSSLVSSNGCTSNVYFWFLEGNSCQVILVSPRTGD